MAHQRGHREPGDLEVGAGDLFLEHQKPTVAERAPPPQWLSTWETVRPKWLQEFMGEAIGVFFYTWFGFGSTAAMITTEASNAGGTLLTVALCYAVGILMGILVAGPNSGGHLHPAFTISFAIFKGFPWRKVPQYIIAQLTGAFIGGLLVYAQYRPQLHALTLKMMAEGKGAMVYSAAGPSGALAIYEPHFSNMGIVWVNEFVCSVVLGIIVYQILDPSNNFVTPSTGPVFISLGFFGAVACYAGNGIALNTARDLGARFAAACFWGVGVFPARMTANACLTNLAGTSVGAAIQVLWLSDSVRPHTDHATQAHARLLQEKEAHLNRVVTARSDGSPLTRVLTGGKLSNYSAGSGTVAPGEVDYSTKAAA